MVLWKKFAKWLKKKVLPPNHFGSIICQKLWLTRFKTLKHDYEHHMDEEEEDIFPKAREVVDEDKDGKHAEAFLTRKKNERSLVDEKAEESLEE